MTSGTVRHEHNIIVLVQNYAFTFVANLANILVVVDKSLDCFFIVESKRYQNHPKLTNICGCKDACFITIFISRRLKLLVGHD